MRFGAATSFGAGFAPLCVAVGDFNGDGHLDLATADGFGNTVAVLLNLCGAATCVGDCDGSGEVTINELITLVNIDLDTANASSCPYGIPGGGSVDIALIIQAVNNALSGCGG